MDIVDQIISAMKKDWNMSLILKGILVISFFCLCTEGVSQLLPHKKNSSKLNLGLVFATAEANYYGMRARYSLPLGQQKHHLHTGVSLTAYFDFTGESGPGAELESDVDMRLIPALFLGYTLQFTNVSLSFEVPIGMSTAITKGTIINENIGFTRIYSNTEFLWHYGIGMDATYQINKTNNIGLFGFYPLTKDIAWTLPYVGIGWGFKFPGLKFQ